MAWSAVSHLAQAQSPFAASPPRAQYSVFSGGHSLCLAFGSFSYPHRTPLYLSTDKLISVTGGWFHWHGDSWLEDAGLPAMGV